MIYINAIFNIEIVPLKVNISVVLYEKLSL